jgi:mono/diheme cytochrome c family protein
VCSPRKKTNVGLVAAWGLAVALGCEPPPSGVAPTSGYLDDPAFARTELTASLVNPSNGYSALRLAHYATGDASDWNGLPEWNPPAEPIAAGELDAPGGASATELASSPAPLALPASVTSADDPALLALGKVAFERYPAQLAQYLRVGLTSRATAARTGLWVDDTQGVGGLVRAQMGDGSIAVALTCSSCHAAAAANGAISPGLPNAALDLGAASLAAEGIPPQLSSDPRAAWGPGRVDVSTAAGTEPARIPDLRPVHDLTYLHQDATVEARDLTTLAIRIETLLITSWGQVVRPPRVVALALAAYVDSLAGALPPPDSASTVSPHGASLFAGNCAACHAPPAFTGAPVALAIIGTDPTLGLSADRGTGTYRVPSLRGVGTRGPLLHDGTLPSVDAMFDPTRVTDAFAQRLHGAGAVPGHPFGLGLSDQDRQDLLTYLHSL